MFKHQFKSVFIGVLLFLSTVVTATAGNIKKFVVVVPIYQELYSQNIGLLLNALYAQKLENLSFSKVDVYFVVNNTLDAKAEVKLENVETVAFLNDLASGLEPKINVKHQILNEVAQKHISSRLDIHVIDWTAPRTLDSLA